MTTLELHVALCVEADRLVAAADGLGEKVRVCDVAAIVSVAGALIKLCRVLGEPLDAHQVPPPGYPPMGG